MKKLATILVVDNRAPDRELLVTLLKQVRHRVLEAADGTQALQLVRSERPDLVISGVLLPKMDGYDLVRQLRADPASAGTKVIFYTGLFTDQESLDLARECGVALILSKTAEPEKILESVAAVLKGTGVEMSSPSSGGFEPKHQQLLIDKLIKQVDELQRREERQRAFADELQALLDAVPAYIFWAHDPECLFMTGNTMTYELLGLPPRSNISQISPEDEPPQHFRAMKDGREIPLRELPIQLAATGQLVREYELDLVFDNGITRCLLGNAVPLLDRSGRPRGAVATFVDVTAQKRTAEGLKQTQAELEWQERERTRQLESANRELEAFSYSVSHDLKAPIRAIEGFARMLANEYSAKLDAEGLRLFEVICTNTKIMSQLIDDLLALSHLGRKQVKKTVFNLAAMVKQVFNQLRVLAPGRDLQLIVKDLPPAYGDLSLINQAMVNFLSNAIKFTKTRKKAVIELGGKTEGTENIYYIKDNGIGFDEQFAHRLFGPFQRLHSREEYEGTGIGLAIVHRIIQRHGGRVWAEGREDQGATFYFALPQNEEVPSP